MCDRGAQATTLGDLPARYALRNERVPEVLAMHYVAELCKMLHALHAQGLLHMDARALGMATRSKKKRPRLLLLEAAAQHNRRRRVKSLQDKESDR